jgi:benzoyl-CoA reductase subunit C
MPDALSAVDEAAPPVPGTLEAVVARAETLAYDLSLEAVREWKGDDPSRHAVGYMPIFIPRQVLAAAGVMPVAVYGGADRIETIRGDAYYQSYICHIPRSTIELALTKRLDCLAGMIFPSTCDVIRNLSGMWQMEFPDRYVRYFDYPQVDSMAIRRDAYHLEMTHLRADMAKLTGAEVTDEALHDAIRRYNTNRTLLKKLYEARQTEPWRYPTSEVYLIVRAGAVLQVEAHNELVAEYLQLAATGNRQPLDNSRVVLRGAFCEQPPLGMIRTLERAGCDIVEDDFLLGARWLTEPVSEEGDPLNALATAYAESGARTASHYTPDDPKGQALVADVRRTNAEGVVFCAPSFCDPALLDQPMLVAACDAAGIPHTAFKYSEDAGQFQVIREQAGTFADSIRLWGGA